MLCVLVVLQTAQTAIHTTLVDHLSMRCVARIIPKSTPSQPLPQQQNAWNMHLHIDRFFSGTLEDHRTLRATGSNLKTCRDCVQAMWINVDIKGLLYSHIISCICLYYGWLL
jgi:hypothetical protein